MGKISKKLKLIIINHIACSALFSSRIRIFFYKICGMNLEKNTYIQPKCVFNGFKIEIGTGTFINYGCIFENHKQVSLGRHCSVGMEVMFCTATHEIGTSKKRVGKLIGDPIKVEDGCWIGSRVTILPGVTIGTGCIIGAGSLVTKDCEPNGMLVHLRDVLKNLKLIKKIKILFTFNYRDHINNMILN